MHYPSSPYVSPAPAPAPGTTLSMPDGTVMQYTPSGWAPCTPPGALALLPASVSVSAKELVLPAAGAFHDLSHKLDGLPGTALATGADAGARLQALKQCVNELQAVRRGYWTKQAAAGGAGAAGALLTMGLTVAAAGAAGLHQRGRIAQVKKAIRGALVQINQIRAHFAHDACCARADRQVTISESVFTRGIDRAELSGDL